MTRPNEDDLQRYHDGDLSPHEAAEVERYLAQTPGARALLRDFETVAQAVRLVAEARGEAADGIAERVMARIDEARSPAAGAAPEGRSPSRRWLRLAPPLGLGVAAAAAAVLYLRGPEVPLPVAVAPPRPSAAVFRAAGPERPLPSEPAPSALAEAESDEGAAIEAVDFGAQNGTIFMVATGAEMTPVVWLMDEGEPGGDRMKPL